MMKDIDGPPVKEHFLDLGVAQAALGTAGADLEDKRLEGAMRRFARIGCLPLPLAQRANVAAASGVSSGIFGVGQHHVTDHKLYQLRKAGLQGLWRTPLSGLPRPRSLLH